MQKLLYINNYHCTSQHEDGYPDNHLWGADYLSQYYHVTCAKIPGDLISNKFSGGAFVNRILRRILLFLKYPFHPIVYSACGELTDAFALANMLHIGKRKLFKIQHHGGQPIHFSKGYSSVFFISPIVMNDYKHLEPKELIEWGGDTAFAARYFTEADSTILYDFISAGKTDRDYECMIEASQAVNARSMIIADINDIDFDPSKVTVISGSQKSSNSVEYAHVFSYYQQSRFIAIPCKKKGADDALVLNGLTSFVDAVVTHKPVLVSDSSNIGIDFEKLGIGYVYEAGNRADMQKKMDMMLHLPEKDYQQMCRRMELYSQSHNYQSFCKNLYAKIRSYTDNNAYE